MATKNIYVNLAVTDIAKTREFFEKIGYTFNPQFSDENALSMVLSGNIYVMLLTHQFFKRFTKKDIVDSKKSTEAILCLGVENREEVDELMKKAMGAGAVETRGREDHGWMYGRSFEDLDGHQWEVAWMDVSQMPAKPSGNA